MLATISRTRKTPRASLVSSRFCRGYRDRKAVYRSVEWGRRDAVIRGRNEEVIFEQKDMLFPVDWSDTAVQIVAQKFFKGPLGSPARESSLQELIDRVVNTIVQWALDGGYISLGAEVRDFGNEMAFLMLHQFAVGNFGDNFAVVADAELAVAGDDADLGGFEAPLLEDAEDFVLAALIGHQQHALLALGEHDLVGRHAGFALRDAVKFDFDADFAAAAHLAGGAGQAGGAHILYADDGAGGHGFDASFQQQFLHEGIAHLH